jgi:hypothetical protein
LSTTMLTVMTGMQCNDLWLLVNGSFFKERRNQAPRPYPSRSLTAQSSDLFYWAVTVELKDGKAVQFGMHHVEVGQAWAFY